ncbi:unnamed protein product [Pleuronectes platessa]|uniref:Uncharacterized protein n=1 Tax=Pleuronectes platessa TaxID=8262 RepID=A0A9N7URF1_PLEPL|nr:unnamed protein product [Pleuronectes platessa]
MEGGGKEKMRDGRRKREDEGGRGDGGGGESGLVLSLMRILINPVEAALRPPRFIRPEKPDCQQLRRRRRKRRRRRRREGKGPSHGHREEEGETPSLSCGPLLGRSNCLRSDCPSLAAMEAVIGRPRHRDQFKRYYRDSRRLGPAEAKGELDGEEEKGVRLPSSLLWLHWTTARQGVHRQLGVQRVDTSLLCLSHVSPRLINGTPLTSVLVLSHKPGRKDFTPPHDASVALLNNPPTPASETSQLIEETLGGITDGSSPDLMHYWSTRLGPGSTGR